MISPKLDVRGVEVTSVSGIVSSQGISIGERILEVNGKSVNNVKEFRDTIKVENNSRDKFVIGTNIGEYAFLSNETLEIEAKVPSKTRIQKGLELEGGTRILLKPDTEDFVSEKDISDLMEVLKNRLNVYGLTDLKLKMVSTADEKLVLIEIAGVGREEIEGFVAQQGKFEAKIGNETVFRGGKEDIPFVCRDDGVCSGVHSCSEDANGGACRFQFTIKLSPEAARKHADVTDKLDIITTEGGQKILSEQIEFHLDGNLIDSLNVDASLKGSASTDIQISGPGYGRNQNDALDDAVKNMGELQTVLITGSLPYELEIVGLESISPVFGQSLIKNVFLVGFISLLGVLSVIYIRYREWKVLLPVAITLVSEIFIILG
ncbi:MAG: hypothetical protein CMH64_00840, partial [Nanoarchaeota archaeon]|nr:hypothetical protein [Nanoarchaeota archaeon]